MSTLSEPTGNKNPTEIRLQRADTKAQIDGILQHFDVLPSRFERLLFKYISVLLVGNFFLEEVLWIPAIFLSGSGSFSLREFLLSSGFDALSMLMFILVLWRFHVWRVRTPKTLRDLIEKKRIALPDDDANATYLRFLQDYADALASPKRYFLSGFLMFVLGISFVYSLGQDLSEQSNVLVTLLVALEDLLKIFIYLGALYCIGSVIWTLYISGWYVRKLVRVFALRIQPFHPDQCGGLMVLGNFCFGLVSPLLIGSGLIIGYTLLLLLTDRGANVVGLALFGGAALLVLLVYALPATIFAFLLPLRDIHAKMVSEGETDEDRYLARIEALREEIEAQLDANQVEEAKVVQEKKAVLETLHTPFPTWPFKFRSKIFSTVLGVSGSLLTGVIAAALQQYLLLAILPFLFHHP